MPAERQKKNRPRKRCSGSPTRSSSHNPPPKKNILPVQQDDPAPVPGFNLAGRPDNLKQTEGIKSQRVKVQGTFHSSDLTKEPYLHFVVRTNKHEWARFSPDAISIVLHGTYPNPAKNDAATATEEAKAARHSLRAQEMKPAVWIDPTVMGTCFVDEVTVNINNVPVPTNSAVNPLLMQYNRISKIFTSRPKTKFSHHKQIDLATTKSSNNMSNIMKEATKAFDYGEAFSAETGERIPIYLHGIFPFGRKNLTCESIDKQRAQSLYFPPDTIFDVKVHIRRDKLSAVFTSNVNPDKYFSAAETIGACPEKIELAFQEATLEYESVEMTAEQETLALAQYKNGQRGVYPYDIPRSQHQALPSGQTYTENNFQVAPYARLVYIMFLCDWAVMPMPSTNKPLSGFSCFPSNCTGIRVDFAGEKGFYHEKFVNFGRTGEGQCQSEISKKIYFDYLTGKRMTSDSFNDFFPKEKRLSLNQVLCFDLEKLKSGKSEILTVACDFSGKLKSPQSVQAREKKHSFFFFYKKKCGPAF
jgi:hypothetical protein